MANSIVFYEQTQNMKNQVMAMKMALMSDKERKETKMKRIKELEAKRLNLILQSMLLSVELNSDRDKFIRELNQSKRDNANQRNRSSSNSDSDSGFGSYGSSCCGSSCRGSSSCESSDTEFSCDSLTFAPKKKKSSVPEYRFKIKVQIKDKDVKPVICTITSNYTILKIKEQLWGKIATRPSQQELFLNDLKLDNENFASHYGIVENSILQVSFVKK